MSERAARMMALGEEIEVPVKGRRGKITIAKYTLSPLRVRELLELERDALKYFKKSYIDSFQECLESVPESERTKFVVEEARKCSQWGISDLPQRDVYSVNYIPVTDEVRKWLYSEYGTQLEHEASCKMLLLHALDTGAISSEEVHKLSGVYPSRGKVRYDQWWVTGAAEGMLKFVFHSIQRKHPDITEDNIKDWHYAKLVEASRIVEVVTSVSMGNG